MKTITEYSPLIFSKLALAAERRLIQRRQFGLNFWMVAGYSVVGALLSFDIGHAPWEWQFWMVFGPLFIVGELALGQWEQFRRSRATERSLSEKAVESSSDRRIKAEEMECREGYYSIESEPFWLPYQRSEFARSLGSETAA